ncbi:MAG: hypothetical protein LBD84_03785, partial [Campylobacteraceae bacterium]|nr:hypothetical protein [Campylobacteraceae bacterium]
MNLNIFNSSNLFDATNNLFEQLGIKLNSNTQTALQAKTILKEHYKDKMPFSDVKNVYFAGLVDNSIFQHNILNNKCTFEQANAKIEQINGNYDGLMLFALDLSRQPTRTEISELTRAFNHASQKMPAAL